MDDLKGTTDQILAYRWNPQAGILYRRIANRLMHADAMMDAVHRDQPEAADVQQDVPDSYRETLLELAAMDLAPPDSAQDLYTPNQLMARMLRDGEEGYQQTLLEYEGLKDSPNNSREEGRIKAYYDTAISTVNAIRAIAEGNGTRLDPADWRDDLHEHLVQTLSLDR